MCNGMGSWREFIWDQLIQFVPTTMLSVHCCRVCPSWVDMQVRRGRVGERGSWIPLVDHGSSRTRPQVSGTTAISRDAPHKYVWQIYQHTLLITYLCTYINHSLITGIFPNKLTIAKIIPILKKNYRHDFNNYRPISLLPSISKIFEKVVYIQLFQYFTSNNLFHANQYGFRAEYSTELALSELVDRIYSDLDEKQIPIAIFIDL